MKNFILKLFVLFLIVNHSYSQIEPGGYKMENKKERVYIETWLSGSVDEAFYIDSLYYFKGNQLIFIGTGVSDQDGFSGLSGVGFYKLVDKENPKDTTIQMELHLIYGQDKMKMEFKNQSEIIINYYKLK
tara:strand:+ start:998 stop:1387 length:390 start_codon:yes stop_codon:yes gene_type:complete